MLSPADTDEATSSPPAVPDAAGVTDSLLTALAASPPFVASCAAANAVDSEVGGGVGATLMPGKGAEPSGTKDDERSFLLRRSEEASSSRSESAEALVGLRGRGAASGIESGSTPGIAAAVAAAAAEGMGGDLTPFEFPAACEHDGEQEVRVHAALREAQRERRGEKESTRLLCRAGEVDDGEAKSRTLLLARLRPLTLGASGSLPSCT